MRLNSHPGLPETPSLLLKCSAQNTLGATYSSAILRKWVPLHGAANNTIAVFATDHIAHGACVPTKFFVWNSIKRTPIIRCKKVLTKAWKLLLTGGSLSISYFHKQHRTNTSLEKPGIKIVAFSDFHMAAKWDLAQ